MKCPRCGANVHESNRFCENCGMPIMKRGSAQDFAEKPMPAKRPGSKKDRKIIIALVAAIIVAAGAIGAILYTSSDSYAYSQKLKLADQYVTGGDLEKAEIEYKDLIRLDPKRETAYIDLAEKVYVKQNRYSEAYDIITEGEKAAGKSEAFTRSIEIITESEKKSSKWKDAYLEVLKEHSGPIRDYEYPEYASLGTRPGTALCDLNGDGVDELLFFASDEPYTEELFIYTFKDGKAKEITYPWQSVGSVHHEDTEYDRMNAVQAAGGAEYVVYKEKGQKGFTTYSTITDEEIDTVTNRIAIGKDGNAKRISLVGMWFLLYDAGGDGNYGPDHAEYSSDNEACTREQYETVMDQSVGDLETCLFRYVMGEEDEERGHQDNPKLWDKTKDEAVSISYDDMIAKLSEGANAEKEDGKTPEKNSRMSEDGANMEALLKAYENRDFDTAEEINGKLPAYVEEMDVSEEESEAYASLFEDLVSQGVVMEDYALHFITDIDKDGKSEFLVQKGESEADFTLEVYQYRSGNMNKVGGTGFGHSFVCQYPDHNGIIVVRGHMDYENMTIVSLEGGKLKTRQLLEEDRLADNSDGNGYVDLGCKAGWYAEFD